MAATLLSLLGAPASGASTPTSPTAAVWVEPGAGYRFLSTAFTRARHSIDLAVYELEDPAMESLLVARQRAGVSVRVLLDAAYVGVSHNRAAVAVLRAGGVAVHYAPAGTIFHEKYALVDGTRAYVGTGNLVASDYRDTRDVWVEDVAPADVAAVAATFNQDFAGSPSAPRSAGGLLWSPGSAPALEALIASAHHQLLVENEEMAYPPIEAALEAAAARGVRVEVAMTASSSWTSALAALAAHRVVVRVLSSSQLYIHAKLLCVDCSSGVGRAFVGSENFSASSLERNRELGVISASRATVAAVAAAIHADLAVGTPVSPPSAAGGSSASGAAHILSVLSPVAPGARETLVARTRALDRCTLAVTLPSGRISTASGLGAATADAAGRVTWTWWIGPSTGAGTARATLICAAGRASATFAIS